MNSEEEDTELVDLPDEDVPLADVPTTGDGMILYTAIAAISGTGAVALLLPRKKADKEEDA